MRADSAVPRSLTSSCHALSNRNAGSAAKRLAEGKGLHVEIDPLVGQRSHVPLSVGARSPEGRTKVIVGKISSLSGVGLALAPPVQLIAAAG